MVDKPEEVCVIEETLRALLKKVSDSVETALLNRRDLLLRFRIRRSVEEAESELLLSRAHHPAKFLVAAERMVIHQTALDYPPEYDMSIIDESFSEESVETVVNFLRSDNAYLISSPMGLMALQSGDESDEHKKHLWPRDDPNRYPNALLAMRRDPTLEEKLFIANTSFENRVVSAALKAPFFLSEATSAQNVETSYMSAIWWMKLVESEHPVAPLYVKQLIDSPEDMAQNVSDPFLRSLITVHGVAKAKKIVRLAKHGVHCWQYKELYRFLNDWRNAAFAKVEVAQRLAAALILTDTPDDFDVQMPWKAFSIVLPPEFLDPIRRIWCGQFEGKCEVIAAVIDTGRVLLIPSYLGPIREDELEQQDRWFNNHKLQILKNLARGICLTVQNRESHRVSKSSSAKATEVHDRELPTSELYRVAPAIEIDDLRGVVHEVWTNPRKGGSPKYQFVVRGHPRNQAHGPRHSLRRKQWIPPFWKGPKGSRVLLRQYKIADEQDEQDNKDKKS